MKPSALSHLSQLLPVQFGHLSITQKSPLKLHNTEAVSFFPPSSSPIDESTAPSSTPIDTNSEEATNPTNSLSTFPALKLSPVNAPFSFERPINPALSRVPSREILQIIRTSSVDTIPTAGFISNYRITGTSAREIPLQLSNDVIPNWDVFTRSEFPLTVELVNRISLPSIDDSIINNNLIIQSSYCPKYSLVCCRCLRSAYDQHPLAIYHKHSKPLSQSRSVSQSLAPGKNGFSSHQLSVPSDWVFRDWRYRVLGLPEPDWDIPSHSPKVRTTNGYSGDRISNPFPSLSRLVLSSDPLDLRFTKPSFFKSSAENLRSTDSFDISQLPPQQSLFDLSRLPSKVINEASISPHQRTHIRMAPSSSKSTPSIPSRSKLTIASGSTRCAVIESTPRHYWRPRGILTGTIYKHESQARKSAGSSLTFGLTSDARFLISGMKSLGSQDELGKRDEFELLPHLNNNNNNNSPFYVWNCEAFEKNLDAALVRSIEFRNADFVPTDFKVLAQNAVLLIGTDQGGIGTCPIEPSRESTVVANVLEKMPYGFLHWRNSKYDRAVIGLETIQNSLEQILCSLHHGGQIGCWDFRCHSMTSHFIIPSWMGFPTCFNLASNGRALHIGTVGGYLLTYNLSCRSIIQALRAKVSGRPVPILTLHVSQMSQSPTSIFISLGSRRNEVCLVDPITGTLEWVFMSSHNTLHRTQRSSSFDVANVDGNVTEEGHSILCQIPLPSFEFVNLRWMTDSRYRDHPTDNEIRIAIRNCDLGGEGNITTLYRPNSQLLKANIGTSTTDSLGQSTDTTKTTGIRYSDQMDPNILITGGTDRRVRLLDLTRSCEQSYVVIGQQEYDSLLYSTVPIFADSKLVNEQNSADDLWKFVPIVNVERIYSDSKIFSLKPRHLRRRKLATESFGDVSDNNLVESFPKTPLTSPRNSFRHQTVSECVPNRISEDSSSSKSFSYPCSPSALQRIGRSISGLAAADNGHADCITAIAAIPNQSQERSLSETLLENDSFFECPNFLITGGRDGLIKIWS